MSGDRHARRAVKTPKPDKTEFWPTPPCLAAALRLHVLPRFPRGVVLDAGCGTGVLMDAIRAANRQAIGIDLKPQPGAQPARAGDFLQLQPESLRRVSGIVTNPPFSRKARFITRALGLMDSDISAVEAVAVLVREDVLSNSTLSLELNRVTEILMCAWRPTWVAGTTGRPRWSFAWITWQRGYVGSPAWRSITPADLRDSAAGGMEAAA